MKEEIQAVIASVEDFFGCFFDGGGGGGGEQQRMSRISRLDACRWVRRALLKRRSILDEHEQQQESWRSFYRGLDDANLATSPDPCATAATASRAGNVDGEGIGSDEVIDMNLFALFPGWRLQQRLSVKDFISEWLVAFLKVPLTSNGSQWIRALEPLLDVRVGDVVAKCQGFSAAQEALVMGRSSMTFFPLQQLQQGSPEPVDNPKAAVEGIVQAAAQKLALTQLDVAQVAYAYNRASAPAPATGATPALDKGASITSSTSPTDGGDFDDSIGKYQLVVAADGTVLIDCAHLRNCSDGIRVSASKACQQSLNLVLQSLFDTGMISTKLPNGIAFIPRLKGEIVMQVATGSNHFLCRTSSGRIWAFGCSEKGQMGMQASSGTPSWHLVCISAGPVPELPLAAKVVQVACGADHSMCLVDNGLVYGFGSNENGQLGLQDTVIYEPAILLRFERMASAALLNAKGIYARRDFETISMDIPWIVSVACGDRHSVFLTASGLLFACGDNRAGQIGYSGPVENIDDSDSESDTVIPEETQANDVGEDKRLSLSEIHQFPVPVLIEGAHIPTSVAQVACGSRHTSVLSHSGRVFVYGGASKCELKQPSTGSKVWRTVHSNNVGPADTSDPNASSLVYHGDPNKIVNVACCGDLTLASFYDSSKVSDHSSCNLDFASFWWAQDGTSRPSLEIAQLNFLRYPLSSPRSEPPAEEGDDKGEHDDLKDIYRVLCNEMDHINSQPDQNPKHISSDKTSASGDVSKSKQTLLAGMKNFVELLQLILRLYAASQSLCPGVREEAVSLWENADLFLIELVHTSNMVSKYASFKDIVNALDDRFFKDKEKQKFSRARKAMVMGCQIILYRVTQKHTTMPAQDVDFLVHLGIETNWRPHILHDRLWSDCTAESKSIMEPFVQLEEDLLSQRLEFAGMEFDHSNTKAILEAVKELAPRADLALLFLTRRVNVSKGKGKSAPIGQLLSKEYFVEIKTGVGPNCGTDSHIDIEIVGINGTSGERSLTYSDKANAFESGQSDVFSLKCMDLGRIKKVVVRNQAGRSWKLDEIRIWQAGNEGLSYDFPLYGWLDAQIPGDLMRHELWYDPVEAARNRYEYEIKVCTANIERAGTNSSVYITLYGELGDSKRQRLEEALTSKGPLTIRKTFGLFRRGCQDVFRVPVASDIGALKKLIIGVTSFGVASSWIVDSVEVTRFRKDERGQFVKDNSFAGEPTKFFNRSQQKIGLDRKCCEIQLYPDAAGIRSKHRLPAPVVTPTEGSYRNSVDVHIGSSEPDSDVLLTVLFIPDDVPNGRVLGNDWAANADNEPQQADVKMLEFPGREDSSEHGPVDLKSSGQKPGKSRCYVLPATFYDTSTGDSFFNLNTLTFRMKANSNLKLTRSGGTYRLMATTIKRLVAGEKESTSAVFKSGEILVRKESQQAVYRMHVFTGDYQEAGTTANVSVILKGEKGQTHVQVLNASVLATSVRFKTNAPSKKEKFHRGIQELISTAQQKLSGMVGLFGRNCEDVFEFDADDVGDISEVIIWHNNKASLGTLNPHGATAWYLHRVEVVKSALEAAAPAANVKTAADLEAAAPAAIVETVAEGQNAELVLPFRKNPDSNRIFMCRRWLTCKDQTLGTQARLLYSNLQVHAKLVRTYDFAILVPKESQSFQFNAMVLFGDRIPGGASISLRKGQMDKVTVEAGKLYCLKIELETYFGTLSHAILKDSSGFVSAPKGLRLMVTCYERAAYNTVHFVPVRAGALFVQDALTKIGCTSSTVPLGWSKEEHVKSALRVCDRRSIVEPMLDRGSDGEEGQEGAAQEHSLANRAVMTMSKRKETTSVTLKTLDMWLNIIYNVQDFHDDLPLQQMVSACTRLTLVAVAKHGALELAHLQKAKPVFNQDLNPVVLESEIEAHCDLVILNSVISVFDKWRRVESNSYELQQITPARSFAWNLLYWQCCANPPDPDAITFVLENGGFERLELDSESSVSTYSVSGLEADMALLLHFLVLRQIAKYDILALEEAKSEALLTKAQDAVSNHAKGFGKRCKRSLNILARMLTFPLLFIVAFFDIFLTTILADFAMAVYKFFNEWQMFSEFAKPRILGLTQKESRRLAEKWCKTCTGNFNWLNRSFPITVEERMMHTHKIELFQGKWSYRLFQLRQEFMMKNSPTFAKLSTDMSRWFTPWSTQYEEQFHAKKSSAFLKRQSVLEVLCRFQQVDEHRSTFAANSFFCELLVKAVVWALLVYTILSMMGFHLLWDTSSLMHDEISKAIVSSIYDDSHNTFATIQRDGNLWDWANNVLTPWVMGGFVYNGSEYVGDLRMSPVLFRQIRVEPDKDGILTGWKSQWAPGPVETEEKEPLTLKMCMNQGLDSKDTSDVSAAPQESTAHDHRDGCHWENPSDFHLNTFGSKFRIYSNSGYIVQLTKENMVEKLKSLRDSGWIDAATRLVTAEMMVYSKTRDAIGFVSMGVEFSATGWTTPISHILCFKTPQYGIEHVLYMLIFVRMIGNEARRIFDVGARYYFSNLEYVVHFLVALCVFIIFVCQMIMIDITDRFPKTSDNDNPWIEKDPLDPFYINYRLIYTMKVQALFGAVSLLVITLQKLSVATLDPRSGPIVTGIFECLWCKSIWFFLLCYFWLLLGFSLCFFILAPSDKEEYRQVFISFVSMVRAGLAGDFKYSTFEDLDHTVGPMLFIVMIVTTQIIMTNLLIAVVNSEYKNSKIRGERLWKNRISSLMAEDLLRHLPVDSSGQIDRRSSAMLVGHDIRVRSRDR